MEKNNETSGLIRQMIPCFNVKHIDKYILNIVKVIDRFVKILCK